MTAGARTGPDPGPYFFVHVMKTAGMTFNRHIRANFPDTALYPGPDDNGAGYWVIERLRDAIRTQRGDVRVWRGHFPYFVAGWVPDAVTLTLLREPVARTVSLLQQRRTLEFPDRSLEELYDDAGFRARELGNHQTKIFSLAEDEQVATYLAPVDIGPDRLETAKQVLESVDLLGVQEHFDSFLTELRRNWGWAIGEVPRVNVGGPPTASRALRRRIAEDCALDAELYEHACRLLDR